MRLLAFGALLLACVGLSKADDGCATPAISILTPGNGDTYKGGVNLQVGGVYNPEKTGIPLVYVTNVGTKTKTGPYAVDYKDGAFLSTGIAFGPGTYEISAVLSGTTASCTLQITITAGNGNCEAKKEDD